MSSAPDRRLPRLDHEAPIILKVGTNPPETAVMINVSEGGMCAGTTVELHIGDLLLCEVPFPGGHRLLRGRVVWQRGPDPDAPHPIGVGLEFFNLRAADTLALRELVGGVEDDEAACSPVPWQAAATGRVEASIPVSTGATRARGADKRRIPWSSVAAGSVVAVAAGVLLLVRGVGIGGAETEQRAVVAATSQPAASPAAALPTPELLAPQLEPVVDVEPEPEPELAAPAPTEVEQPAAADAALDTLSDVERRALAAPALMTVDRTTEISIPIIGSTEGAHHYALASPAGVAINLPHATPDLDYGDYRVNDNGVQTIWVREREGGLHVRVVFSSRTTGHEVTVESDAIRVRLELAD